MSALSMNGIAILYTLTPNGGCVGAFVIETCCFAVFSMVDLSSF